MTEMDVKERQAELPYTTIEEAVMKPWTGIDMTKAETYVAGLILEATSDRPIKQADVIDRVHFGLECKVTPRQIRAIVRNLRRVHGFPIRKALTICRSTDGTLDHHEPKE